MNKDVQPYYQLFARAVKQQNIDLLEYACTTTLDFLKRSHIKDSPSKKYLERELKEINETLSAQVSNTLSKNTLSQLKRVSNLFKRL